MSDVVEEDGMEDEDEDEMDEIETGSDCRTHDEQMDYLESLEHCPCYAKCICDSIITLFCVTMKRQIKHMIRYRYIPFTWGKPKYAAKEEQSAGSGPAPPSSQAM